MTDSLNTKPDEDIAPNLARKNHERRRLQRATRPTGEPSKLPNAHGDQSKQNGTMAPPQPRAACFNTEYPQDRARDRTASFSDSDIAQQTWFNTILPALEHLRKNGEPTLKRKHDPHLHNYIWSELSTHPTGLVLQTGLYKICKNIWIVFYYTVYHTLKPIRAQLDNSGIKVTGHLE